MLPTDDVGDELSPCIPKVSIESVSSNEATVCCHFSRFLYNFDRINRRNLTVVLRVICVMNYQSAQESCEEHGLTASLSTLIVHSTGGMKDDSKVASIDPIKTVQKSRKMSADFRLIR